MGDVVVENPANQVLPHRKQMPSSIPNIDTLEGLGTDGSDEYSTLKKLQRHLEWVGLGISRLRAAADGFQIYPTSGRIHQG
jgi:26S proteasome regulatory subunit T3